MGRSAAEGGHDIYGRSEEDRQTYVEGRCQEGVGQGDVGGGTGRQDSGEVYGELKKMEDNMGRMERVVKADIESRWHWKLESFQGIMDLVKQAVRGEEGGTYEVMGREESDQAKEILKTGPLRPGMKNNRPLDQDVHRLISQVHGWGSRHNDGNTKAGSNGHGGVERTLSKNKNG